VNTIPTAADGGSEEMHFETAALSANEQHEARARAGFFWNTPADAEPSRVLARDAHLDPYADKSGLVHLARSFLEEVAQRAEQLDPVKLGDPITEDEWLTARSSQPPIVDQWFYEDVGCFIAPGGTGKTTLLLFQVIHIVLGRELFGYEVRAPGPVVIMTAEDSRETLIARLRQMCAQLGLSKSEIATVREDVIVTDVSGKGVRLTTVQKDVVMPSSQLDRLTVEVGFRKPSLLIIDPMVSFGVGESRVNDAEQGMIDAARRIRNVAKCGVLYVHHTGKDNARNRTTDQYSGRGGSALADGSRMVHVLQRLSPNEWTEATGDVLEGDDSGFVLARPKMTWCPPQPDVYLRRHGYCFHRVAAVEATDGASTVTRINAEKLHQFLKDEFVKGIKHTGRTLEAAKLLPQKATREAVQRLVADGRVASEDLGNGGRGGARTYLRPLDLPMTT
jgi:regulatory protein RepA